MLTINRLFYPVQKRQDIKAEKPTERKKKKKLNFFILLCYKIIFELIKRSVKPKDFQSPFIAQFFFFLDVSEAYC